jgi:hypothetical protein
MTARGAELEFGTLGHDKTHQFSAPALEREARPVPLLTVPRCHSMPNSSGVTITVEKGDVNAG